MSRIHFLLSGVEQGQHFMIFGQHVYSNLMQIQENTLGSILADKDAILIDHTRLVVSWDSFKNLFRFISL